MAKMQRCSVRLLACAIVLALISSIRADAQQLTKAMVDEMLDFAKAAQSTSSTPTDAVRTFEAKCEDRFGAAAPMYLVESKSIRVALVTPMMVVRIEIASHLRKMEPLGTVSAATGVGIRVEPLRIDSMDVANIVVTRDRQRVEPIRSTLTSQVLHTAAGATVSKHAGVILFPETAFAPGAAVHVSVIPEAGQNAEIDLPGKWLASLTTKPDDFARLLLQATAQQVESRLGKPTSIEGRRWTYVRGMDRLAIYFNDADVVVDVQPPTFPMSVFAK
jgi:hypothetical protein